MKKTVDIQAADTDLAKLVEEAAAGNEIILEKAGEPIARIVPVLNGKTFPGEKKDIASTFGMLKGQVWISEDFDAPLPPEILRSFGIEPEE